MVSVSVVIPTLKRPALLERAIRSVLAQTYAHFEIIVVVDGPDDSTDTAAAMSMDPRIRVLRLPVNVGLAEARNQGIRLAQGRWIALLDDDDEWLPLKLSRQVLPALESGSDHVFVPCRFLEKSLTMSRVLPDRLPSSASRFSEYIYCEGGVLQPSTYFMSRQLALDVPFTKGLRHVEDTDWLLRMAQHPLVVVRPVGETLSIYYNLQTGKRESETTPWRHPLTWATVNHRLFTRRAYPFFVARLCLNASRAREPFTVFLQLLSNARTYGTLTPKVVAFFLAYWFFPAETLARVRTAARSSFRVPRTLLPAQLRRMEHEA